MKPPLYGEMATCMKSRRTAARKKLVYVFVGFVVVQEPEPVRRVLVPQYSGDAQVTMSFQRRWVHGGQSQKL